MVIRVGGMSCAHCVAHVTEALMKLENVENVTIHLESGKVTLEGQAEEAAVRAAVEDAGYDYLGVTA